MNAEARLNQLLAMDAPAERDPSFTLRVMEGMARRKLAADVVNLCILAVAACAVAWALGPALGDLVGRGLAPFASSMAAPVLALVLTLVFLVGLGATPEAGRIRA